MTVINLEKALARRMRKPELKRRRKRASRAKRRNSRVDSSILPQRYKFDEALANKFAAGRPLFLQEQLKK